MNIVVSGWNGVGSSTLCLILAKKLKLKLVQGTQTFRLLGEKLSYGQTGLDRIKADDYLESLWGPIYDNYIDYLLVNETGLVVETDIAAFRLGKRSEYFSIFLIADVEVRATRFINDGRQGDEAVLVERDESLKKSYFELHGIDWTDLEQIQSKYNLMIDTSHLDIAAELELIYTELEKQNLAKKEQLFDFKQEEKRYWAEGKPMYQNFLKENNLVIEGKEIVEEIRKRYKKEILEFPPELKTAIYSI